jgi:hypothetical protein
MIKSELNIFPEIQISHDFPEINDDEFYKSIQFLKGKNPEYKRFYAANEASNILKYKQLCIISNLLRKNGFNKFMTIKGMYLLNTLFSNFFGIRPMADIDIVVHPDEFKKIPAFLKEYPEMKLKSHFHPFLRQFFGEDFAIIYNDTVIELHSNIALIQFRKLMKEVFENIITISTPDKMEFSVPTIEYSALIMLIHDYTRDDFIDLTFRRLLEFYIVIYNCNFKKLLNIAKKHRLETMLDCHLYMISRMLKNPFFDKESFFIHPQFEFIEKTDGKGWFSVKDKMALQKVLYGRRWKYLRLRNGSAEIFKKLFGKKKAL